MVATIYQYSVTGSIAAGQVSPKKLDTEIRDSTITIALDGITQNGDVLDIIFKDELPTTGALGDQELILSGVLAAHDGVPPSDPTSSATGAPIFALEKTQKDGAPLVAIQGRVGSETIYATHNFCDETTWYNGSNRVTSASLVMTGSSWYHSGVGLNSCWIDMTHGKMFDEEGLVEDQQIFATQAGGDPHGYSVHVVVSGVVKTQRSSFESTGGDYTVDYASGTITPVSGQDWTGQDVIACFSYKGSSYWYLEPLPNKTLVMEKAEIQFSHDTDYNTTLEMGVEGFAAIFAPQYIQANGGPLPNDARIPLESTLYKTVDQLVDEAIMAFPQIPVITSSNGRGYTQPKNIFQFHYAAVRKIYASLGMRVFIKNANDISFGGERATATFYCTSEDDPGTTAALQAMGLL